MNLPQAANGNGGLPFVVFMFEEVVRMAGEINLSLNFPNAEALMKKLESHEKAVGKALNRTVGEFKKRAPAWVRMSVASHYGIKKGDIKKPYIGKSGTVKIGGVSVDNIQLKYSGGVLTPTHFKMRPTARPQKKYKVTAVIKGGARKELSPIAFLARAKKPKPNASNAETASIQIPFQRTGEERLPIMPIKTVSIPQMITNEEVAAEIKKRVNEGLEKRLEHNLEQELAKLK